VRPSSCGTPAITPSSPAASPVATVEDESTEDVEQYYGALKALCEAVVEEVFPGHALQAAKLTFRPLEQTARGALEHAELVEGVGLTPEREAQLLEEWRSRPT